MPNSEVTYEPREELWIIDGYSEGCPEPPPFARLPTLEEIESWKRGELKKPFVVRTKRIKWPNDEKRSLKLTAKDPDDLRLHLDAIERFLEWFGSFSTKVVVTLPGFFEVVQEGKDTSMKTLKPIRLTATYKLKLQNEVVSEGGGIRWQRVPDY